jgi:hypothetical protein
VYRAYFLLLLLLLNACSDDPPSEVTPDYGEAYFYIGCYWPNPAEVLQPAIWRCFENVETELLSGFLYLELENSNSLYFCGENLTLRSGIGMYDNLITYLTNNKYDCLHITEDKEEGNAFDWFWDPDKNVLQITWRPDEEPHKRLTLVVENSDYNQVARSTVYYKILLED